jgi:hypothetical protein
VAAKSARVRAAVVSDALIAEAKRVEFPWQT